MKPLENVWSGLLQRRLLPVAILLVAALAAIPFVLAKDPKPVTPAPAPAAENESATASAATAEPVVSLVQDGERTKRRRVLGVRKNPFEPAKAPKVKEAAAPSSAATETAATTETEVTGGADAGKPAEGGSAPSDTTAPGSGPAAPVAPAPTTEKKPKYELYSLTVRFGDAESDSLAKLNLARLKALPSAEDPVLVYLGPGKDGKSAVFMVDDAVEPQGDAECKPSPRNCETIHLREGETEFLDVVGEDGTVESQYQLDLVDIKTRKTASAAKAAQARAKVSKAGRRALRVRQSALGPLRYRYDATSGTVRKLQKRAYKALLAKTARIALGTAGGF